MRLPYSAWAALPAIALLSLIPHRAEAACSFGGSSETSLQGVFDSMFGAGAAPDTVNGCVTDPGDALWRTIDSVGSATILVEIAGNANGNVLGIYDSTDPSNTLSLFTGPADAGDRAFVTIESLAGGGFQISVDRVGFSSSESDVAIFGSDVFGFFLQQPGDTDPSFYSDSSLNPLINGVSTNGSDYMYSYTGNDATFLASSPFVPTRVQNTQFRENDAIIAWEDLSSGSDRDYQDMIVLLRDMTPSPVPLPAAAWLLMSGLLGVGVVGRRRAQA